MKEKKVKHFSIHYPGLNPGESPRKSPGDNPGKNLKDKLGDNPDFSLGDNLWDIMGSSQKDSSGLALQCTVFVSESPKPRL